MLRMFKGHREQEVEEVFNYVYICAKSNKKKHCFFLKFLRGVTHGTDRMRQTEAIYLRARELILGEGYDMC